MRAFLGNISAISPTTEDLSYSSQELKHDGKRDYQDAQI